MTTSLENFRDEAQFRLGDSGGGTFTNSLVEQWINDGLVNLSHHIPALTTVDFLADANTRTYELSDSLGVVSVEYPAGQFPPLILSRVDDLPYGVNGYYTVHSLNTAGVTDSVELAVLPIAGETITVTYRGLHGVEDGDLTLPTAWEEALHAFVKWKAIEMLEASESIAPTSNSSLLMSQLSSNANSAEANYRANIREFSERHHPNFSVRTAPDWVQARAY